MIAQERYGVDGQAGASDDGIVIRIPDTDADPPGGDVVVFEAEEVEDLVREIEQTHEVRDRDA